jgi:hypothetical protein
MAVGPAQPLKTSGGVDKKFNRTYRATFQVIASQKEGPLAVLNAPGIPGFGNAYYWYNEYDLWTFVDGGNAEPQEEILYDLGNGVEKCRKWVVTITWSTATTERSQTDPRSNPLNEPPVISGSFIGDQELVFRDIDDKPIANTAGEGVPQPPTILSGTDGLSISYNTGSINLRLRSQAMGKVNKTSIWGLDPRQVKLMSWRWSILYAGPLSYIKNDFEFHISYRETPSTACIGSTLVNKQGWYNIYPNEGFAPLELPNDLGTRKVKKDKQDIPLNTPVRLNCDGTELDGEMKWNIFKVEREFDFTTIPGMPAILPGPFS